MTAASVADLLPAGIVETLALPSNIRYGTAIFTRGGVTFITVETAVIEAWVGGLSGAIAEGAGQRRRTTLSAGPDGLEWQCAGNPKNHQIFCKHCVALALAIQNGFAEVDPQ